MIVTLPDCTFSGDMKGDRMLCRHPSHPIAKTDKEIAAVERWRQRNQRKYGALSAS